MEIIKKIAKEGYFDMIMNRPTKYCKSNKLFGLEMKDIDIFHHQVVGHELYRGTGFASISIAITTGIAIGLPPVINFGSEELQDRIVPQCLTGEKLICLAITEPWGGSDVANLKTTARKSECGKFYIVNGMKKWITNGSFC